MRVREKEKRKEVCCHRMLRSHVVAWRHSSKTIYNVAKKAIACEMEVRRRERRKKMGRAQRILIERLTGKAMYSIAMYEYG